LFAAYDEVLPKVRKSLARWRGGKVKRRGAKGGGEGQKEARVCLWEVLTKEDLLLQEEWDLG